MFFKSDASRAVFGEDNKVLGEHTINVAISNPPRRNPKKEFLSKPLESKTHHTEPSPHNEKPAQIFEEKIDHFEILQKETLHPEQTQNEIFHPDRMQDETIISKPTQDEAQSTRSTQDTDQSRSKETKKAYPKSLGAK